VRSRFCSAAIIGGWLAFAAAARAQSATQASSYSDQPITVGGGGYTLNFSVQWSCDDAPAGTNSAPGRIDLIDAGGGTVAELSATLGGGSPVVTVSGAGAATNVSGELDQSGSGGTPANGFVSGTWTLSGIAAGNYTLRYWGFQEANSSSDASTVWTATSDAGGSGPIASPNPAPTAPTDSDPPEAAAPAADPTPAPASAPPPSIAISAPTSIAAGQSFYASATATAAAGGNPLQTVILESSTDGGATWSAIGATPNAANPSDTEGNPAEFSLPGTVELRALVYDTAGQEGTADQLLTVVPASEPVADVAAPPPDPAPPAPATAATDDSAPDPTPAGASTPSPTADLPSDAPTAPNPTPAVVSVPDQSAAPAPAVVVAASPAVPTPAPAGAILQDDAASTLRSDRVTALHRIISGPTSHR